jgi:hypothetical protein
MKKYIVLFYSLILGNGVKGPTNILKAIGYAFYFSFRAGTLFLILSENEYKKKLKEVKI